MVVLTVVVPRAGRITKNRNQMSMALLDAAAPRHSAARLDAFIVDGMGSGKATSPDAPDDMSVGPPAPPSPGHMSPNEQQLAVSLLVAEYNILMAALSAAWSASLTRTSLYLGVLSAAGVAFGFAAQGGVDTTTFLAVAWVVLLLVLFLGVATFVRLVQVQRESMVYLTGMNRIRHFFQETAPGTRPYFVLPANDDDPAIFRSIGSGMVRRPPRHRLMHLTVQTQGIVGVVTAVVAAACAGIPATRAGSVAGWVTAVLAFLVTLVALFTYWHLSLAELRKGISPMNPTPLDQLNARF